METSQNKVSLYFPTIYSLWSFAMLLRNRSVGVNTGENLLTTACSERELENAIKYFGAFLVDYYQEQNRAVGEGA